MGTGYFEHIQCDFVLMCLRTRFDPWQFSRQLHLICIRLKIVLQNLRLYI